MQDRAQGAAALPRPACPCCHFSPLCLWLCATNFLPSRRIRQEAELPRQQVLESKRLARAALSHIARHHEEVAPLFELLTIFSSGTGAGHWLLGSGGVFG